LIHHPWTCEQWKLFRPPLLTCEPVLTEAVFLLKREGREADPVFALLERGAVRIALDVQEQQADLRADAPLSNLPPPREQGNPGFDARLNRRN
jgi:hypothetical protein